jgi:mannose-6-phosphate isomerase-like protein (cupin superfamily)
MSAITLRKAGSAKTADTSADSRPKLFVTRCILAPGAPLNPLVEGTDVLIVGMNNGELVNEKKSPPSQVNVSNGLVMLMPKEEPYLPRNIGKENLELLVIEVRK